MRILRELQRFLFPKQRSYLNHGGRLINPYHLPDARDEEKTLILAGVARSPDDAAYLLKRYKTKSAREVLRHVAPRRRPITFRQRWRTLVRRLDGHNSRDLWGKRSETPTIRVVYRYRLPK